MMLIEILRNVSLSSGLIYIGLNLTMSSILKRNGYKTGFWIINFRLMRTFNTMIKEEGEESRAKYYLALYYSIIASLIICLTSSVAVFLFEYR